MAQVDDLQEKLKGRLAELLKEHDRRLAELNALTGRIAECQDTLAMLGDNPPKQEG